MSEIPFSTFEGYLKKVDLSQRPDIEIALFERVFPRFFDKREIKQEVRERIKADCAPFWPLIQTEEDIDPPRRFAGIPDLPHGRYYTICKDSSGDDIETLANELRAYRDPIATGRVGVADLMSEQLSGPPRPAFAVIVYEVDKIPFARQLLRSKLQASEGTKNLLIVEYPCEVVKTRIERTIDLRMPTSQRWFFEQFSKEQDDHSIVWVLGQALAKGMTKEMREQLEKESVTIMSRFQRKACVPPKPRDFYAMLPTLMNPDQGGGVASEGAGILEAIGTWMRYNEVGALIYPSSRSDVFIELESGALMDYRGWNLLDYRGTRPKGIKPIYMVRSPWAWTGFPRGVRIEVETKDLIRNGSFQIIGMRACLKRDYESYVKSLEEVDAYAAAVGQHVLFEEDRGVTRAAAWRLGSSSIEWLTLNAVDKKPAEGRREWLLFSGLARKLARSYAAGWMDEIAQELITTVDFSKAVVGCMDIADWIAETWMDEGRFQPARILVLCNRLHVLRFFVAGSLLAQNAGLAQGRSGSEQVSLLLGELDIESCGFSDGTQQAIATVLKLGLELCGRHEMGVVHETGTWGRIWEMMCETTWRELCRSQ